MNDIRKQIIELIEPYMDKSLSKGCLIKSKYFNEEILNIIYSYYGQEFYFFFKDSKSAMMLNKNSIERKEILGHYDITAVLKYIDKKNHSKFLIIIPDEHELCIEFEYKNGSAINLHIPNKPLHLFTEQEEKELLDLLLKLK